MKTVAGIRRHNKFSPNHIGNDGAIFDLTVQNLKTLGYQVNEYPEEEFLNELKEQYIFSMARDPKTLKILQEKENQGAVVINSGYGSANCYRSAMTNLLNQEGIPSPNNCIVSTNNTAPDIFELFNERPFWVKRGDFHAIHKEDVSYVRNNEEGAELIREYARRGIESVVLCEHICGDLVKFYGVADSNFFYWFYPSESGHSKFGNETINGKIKNTPFQSGMLKFIANNAANILKIDIYGGDAIITPEGHIYIIDVNDWPSFAPCRNKAAETITKRIHQQIEKASVL